MKWVKNNKVILCLLLIILLGSFLRIYDLGAESLWYDEASSVHGSTQDLATVVAVSGEIHNQPPLYFAFLHFWMLLFGTGEAAIRFLSAIFGIVSIFLIYKVGCQLFNQKIGLISSFISSISYFHIYHSQEARSYSLLLMLTLLSFCFFIKILESVEKRPSHFAFLLLTNVALAYTHVYGLLVIAAQVFYFLLFWNKYKQLTSQFLGVYVATAAFFSPWISTLLKRTSGLSESFSVPETSLGTIVDTIKTYSAYGWGEQYLLPAFLLLFLASLFIVRRLKGLESRPEIWLLLIWFAFSIIIPFTLSQFIITKYQPRYTIAASPAFYLLVARGIGILDKKRLIYPILLVITLLSLPGLHYYYTQNVKEEWRQAADFVESNSQPNDIILISKYSMQKPFDYYYQGDLERVGIDPDVDNPSTLAAIVDNVTVGKERLWLVIRTAEAAHIGRYLLEIYGSKSILAQQDLKGIEVYLTDLPFTQPGQIPEDTFTRGLVAYWAMDEGSGQYVLDGSGKGNHGRLGDNDSEAGDPADPKWTTGRIGNALLFDGVDDYVDCGSDDSLDITGAVTLEAWIYLNKTPVSAGHKFRIISKRDATHGYEMYMRDDDNTVRAHFKGLTDDFISGTGTPLETNKWYHVVVIWDGLLMRSYINGVLDLIDDSSGTIAFGPDIKLSISHKSRNFAGIIDEVRIYNRALSAEEVRYHYNQGSQ